MVKEEALKKTDLIDESKSNFRVARAAYTDHEIFEIEMKNIFEANWVYICHESQIPKIGNYYSAKIGRQPVFVIRQNKNEIGGFVDACSHRGATLSRTRRGSMKTITCRFHGWCFDLKGRCTKIKEEEVGWPSGVEKNKFNLKSLARVKNYKGFIYVSLEEPPQELEDFLGEAKYFIDLLAEQSPLGMEIVPGTQSYMVQGNWKLQAENGVDGYHVSTVHRVFARAMAKRESAEVSGYMRKTEAARITGSTPTGVSDLGGGHMLLWAERGNPEVAPLAEQRSSLLKIFDAGKVDWMINKGRNLFLFPNIHLMDQSSTQIRVLIPHAPDRTEIKVYCIAPKGESNKARKARRRKFEDFFMVTGMATPDDMAALEDVQRGSGAELVKWNEFDRGRSSMVSGADETIALLGANPISTNPHWSNETLYYGFYKTWLEAIS